MDTGCMQAREKMESNMEVASSIGQMVGFRLASGLMGKLREKDGISMELVVHLRASSSKINYMDLGFLCMRMEVDTKESGRMI